MLQIKVLEAELKKQDAQDKMVANREEVKHPESYLQLVICTFLLFNKKIIVSDMLFLCDPSCKHCVTVCMCCSTSGTAARRGSLFWRPV